MTTRTIIALLALLAFGEASADADQTHPIVPGHVHDFDLAALRSAEGEPPLHRQAYYTLNEIPSE